MAEEDAGGLCSLRPGVCEPTGVWTSTEQDTARLMALDGWGRMVPVTIWDEREGPILASLSVADTTASAPDSSWISAQTGLPPEQVGHGLHVLIDGGYVSGDDVTAMGDPAPQYMELRLTSEGREAVGTWNRPQAATSGEMRATIVEVLIASPSDTTAERDRVERAIHDWNGLHAVEVGVVLLPRRWERDAHAAMGAPPQAIVNSQIVDRSRILVGVFWTRLGTPTSDADSGTAEEIDRFISAGKPVHLYFSDRPAAPTTIDSGQLERLKAYKLRLVGEGLLGEFTELDDLAQQVTAALTQDVREIAAPRDDEARGARDLTSRIDVVQVPAEGSGARVAVRSVGGAEAEDVTVALEGALFMLNADGARIGGDVVDEIGTLTPGSSRTYNVMRAAQTTNGRVRVTARGLDPIEIDLT